MTEQTPDQPVPEVEQDEPEQADEQADDSTEDPDPGGDESAVSATARYGNTEATATAEADDGADSSGDDDG